MDFAARILEDQDPWRDMQGAEKLLKLIPDKGIPGPINIYKRADGNVPFIFRPRRRSPEKMGIPVESLERQ